MREEDFENLSSYLERVSFETLKSGHLTLAYCLDMGRIEAANIAKEFKKP